MWASTAAISVGLNSTSWASWSSVRIFERNIFSWGICLMWQTALTNIEALKVTRILRRNQKFRLNQCKFRAFMSSGPWKSQMADVPYVTGDRSNGSHSYVKRSWDRQFRFAKRVCSLHWSNMYIPVRDESFSSLGPFEGARIKAFGCHREATLFDVTYRTNCLLEG